jgi:hypothetical protein
MPLFCSTESSGHFVLWRTTSMIHNQSVIMLPASPQQAHQAPTPTAATPRKIRTRRPGQWCWLDTATIATYGPRIGAFGIAVYAVLAAHANGRTQACWPSIGRIACLLKLSRSTVKTTLRTLRKEGLIAIDPRRDAAGDPTSNSYTLLDPTPESAAALAAVPQGGRSPDDPPSVTTCPTGGVPGAPKPAEPQPEERTSKASDFRSAQGRGEAQDETPSWNTPPVALPSTPPERPDDILEAAGLSIEERASLAAEARVELVADGTKEFCITKPTIEAKMVTILERRRAVVSAEVRSDTPVAYREDLAPGATSAAA